MDFQLKQLSEKSQLGAPAVDAQPTYILNTIWTEKKRKRIWFVKQLLQEDTQIRMILAIFVLLGVL